MPELDIKSQVSTAVDLDHWFPTTPEDLYLDLCLTVGEPNSDAGNDFHALVASPEALRLHADGDVISQRATLVFGTYSPDLLRQALTSIVAACQGRDWDDSVQRLNRYFRWEYEDYSSRGAVNRLELRRFTSPDIELAWWRPDVYEDVDFGLDLTVGEADSDCEEAFSVQVATPEGLREHGFRGEGDGDVLAERATLILADYSPNLLRRALQGILSDCSGWSWQHSLQKLSRYFRRQDES